MLRKKSNTCIAVIKDRKGRLVMAGDRRISWDDCTQAQSMPRPKIMIDDNGLLFGGTGDSFLCSVVINVFVAPALEVDDNDVYMYHIFLKHLQKCLSNNNLVDLGTKNLKIPFDMSAEIIVGIRGHLYTVSIYNPDPHKENSNGIIAIDEVSVPYATGCGGALAWGSLLSTQGDKIDNLKLKLYNNFNIHKIPNNIKTLEEYRLYYALQVAAHVSPGCDSKVDIIKELSNDTE